MDCVYLGLKICRVTKLENVQIFTLKSGDKISKIYFDFKFGLVDQSSLGCQLADLGPGHVPVWFQLL